MNRYPVPMVLVCLSLLLLAPSEPEESRSLSVAIEQLIEADQWVEAIALLEPLAKDPKHEPAQFWLGMAYWSTGRYPEAATRFTRALAVNADYRPSAQMLARCARKLGNPGLAAPAEAAFPDDAQILHNIGRSWVARYLPEAAPGGGGLFDWGDKKQDMAFRGYAQSYFERSASLSDAFPENDAWLAYLYSKGYNKTGAVKHAKRAARAGLDKWEQLTYVGHALKDAGLAVEAHDAFALAKQLAPHRKAGLDFLRGVALFDSEQYEASSDLFRNILDYSFQSPFVRGWLARAASKADRPAVAMWAAKASKELDDEPDAVLSAARAAVSMGKYRLAEKLATTHTQGNFGGSTYSGVEDYYLLGRARLATGQFRDGMRVLKIAAFSRHTDMNSVRWMIAAYMERDDPHSVITICRTLGEKGHTDVALKIIQNVVMKKWPKRRLKDFKAKKAPHDLMADQVMADIHFYASRFHSALELYKKVGFTRGRQTRPRAAWCYALLDRLDDAQEAFVRCAQHAPKTQKPSAWIGLGWTQLMQGDPAGATQTFSLFKPDSRLRQAGLFAAARLAGNRTDATSNANTYSALGLVEGRIMGKYDGIVVQALYPGGLLAQVTPTIYPGDIIETIDSRWVNEERLAALSKETLPDKQIDIRINRKGIVFRAMLDYPALAKAIAPTEKEAEPGDVKPGEGGTP